jgi:hypothetical protein
VGAGQQLYMHLGKLCENRNRADQIEPLEMSQVTVVVYGSCAKIQVTK